jgi:hypothetical protein
VLLHDTKNCNMQCFLEKTLQNTTFWVNFKEIFFPCYILWLWMLFLVIFYSLEHVKLIVASDKRLHSAFLKE